MRTLYAIAKNIKMSVSGGLRPRPGALPLYPTGATARDPHYSPNFQTKVRLCTQKIVTKFYMIMYMYDLT